ncbi:MerR family transcriptional regulator, partial [Streptomyces sp. NPDC057927]
MDGRRRNPYELTEETPVYVISVAAQLSGLHPQTLRQYDRLGLVSPDRTAGRGRRYSARDIELLRTVQALRDRSLRPLLLELVDLVVHLAVGLHARPEQD